MKFSSEECINTVFKAKAPIEGSSITAYVTDNNWKKMNNHLIVVMVGVPASGKSTIAKKMEEENGIYKRVSRDEIRFSMLNNGEQYFAKEKEVYDTYIEKIVMAIKEGFIPIADATHLTSASRNKLKAAVRRYFPADEQIKYYYLVCGATLSIEEILRRNALRSGKERVPDGKIEEMYYKFEQTKESILRSENVIIKS
jgi:predicted kinase